MCIRDRFYAQEASLFLTQADKAGLDVQFFGCDGLDGVIDQLGSNASLAEGVMLLTPFAADSENPESQAFTAAYEKKYNGEVPNQFAADAYDAMFIIKAAAEKAGITPDTVSYTHLLRLSRGFRTGHSGI